MAEKRKRRIDSGPCCPYQLGLSKLDNGRSTLTYPKIKKKKEPLPDDVETQKRSVLKDLQKHGINVDDLRCEEDISSGKRWWICPNEEPNKRFHSSEHFRNHIFKKKNISQSDVERQTFQYNMGNETFTNNPDEAMDILLNREFPDVPKFREDPHDFICIPDSFLLKTVTSKVDKNEDPHVMMVINEEGWETLEDETKIEKVEKHIGDLKGQETEETFYYKLKTTFQKLKVKNTFIISGFEVKGSKNVLSKEIDFLIVNSDTKTIIQVEVKKTFSEKTNAFSQVQKGFEFFNSNDSKLPFMADNNWYYCKAVYFEAGWDSTKTNCCSTCQQHIIHPQTDLSQWWQLVTEQQEASNSSQNDLTYLNIVKYILHQMYQQGDIITPTDVLRETEKFTESISAIENIFFWSNVQHAALKDSIETKKIAFLSPFGTGKTTLLKEKAKRLLKKGAKVVIIIFQNEEVKDETLLVKGFKREFQDFHQRVSIHQICSTDQDAVETVNQIVDENPIAHFFFDEVFAGVDGFPTEELNDIAERLPKYSYFWIACQSEHAVEKEDLKDFIFPEMKHPLRYSSRNLEVAEKLKTQFGETSFPSDGINPKIYLNRGLPSLFLALKKDVHLVCAVEQLAYILDKERSKTIIKIDFEKESILPALKESVVKDRLLFADGCPSRYAEFVDPGNNEKILVLCTKDNTLIRGSEVTVLVHFTSVISGEQIQDIYSRCKSKLIIICNEECANKVITSNSESNALGVIQVHGELMPKQFEDAIQNSNKQKLIKFLKNTRKRTVPVDSRTKASQTGLMIACQFGTAEIVDVFLSLDADLDAIDANGWSPIHFAAARGDLEIIKTVATSITKEIKSGKLTTRVWHAKTNNGNNTIHLAAEEGHLNILKFLLDTGFLQIDEVNDFGNTALHLASRKNHLNMVQFMIKGFHAKTNIQNRDGCTPLHLASEEGHFDVTRSLLKHCAAECNVKDRGGWSPLHLAAKNGHTDVVKLLIQEGKANITLHDGIGCTPLHLSSSNGHIDITRFLVKECKADLNSKKDNGQTSLHLASYFGHFDIVKCLIDECGADFGKTALEYATSKNHIDVCMYILNRAVKVNKFNLENKIESLHIASESGHLDILKCFITDCGVNVNSQDNDGLSVLHYASQEGHLEFVKWLTKEAKADFNLKSKDGSIPLHIASLKGHLDIVKHFITDCGVNVNSQDNDGWSVLHYASHTGHLEVVKWLTKEAKAEINLKSKTGSIPLHHASFNGHLDIVNHFITDCGVNVNFQDNDGWSSLHKTSEEGHLEVVKWLTKEGKADVNLKSKKGDIPLHIASFHGHLDIVKYFITDCGVNVNFQDNDGWSALHYASKEGHLEVVKWLTKEGRADFNFRDKNGSIPLHIASSNGHLDVVKHFITDCGVNVNSHQKDGRTALHIASQRGHLGIVEFLVDKAGADVNLQDNHGHTSLDLAESWQKSEVVQFLTMKMKS